MKVLHIGKYFPPHAGGMENYLKDLMVEQHRQGIQAVALVHQSAISLRSTTYRITICDQRLLITKAAVWARLLFTPLSPSLPFCLAQLINEHAPDIIHLHMPNLSALWVLLLPATRGIPLVVHWQSDVVPSDHSIGLRFFYRLYRPLEQSVLKRCDKVLVTSTPYLNSSLALRHYRNKCVVVPLGMDPTMARFPPPVGALTPSRTSLRVLAVGRLTYYKGFDVLLKATAKMPKIQLHLVGSGEREKHLKKLATGLGLNQRVFFHGYLPDSELGRQFSDCDCVCLPSIERTESFGLVLLEAMLHGKATIASDVPGSGMGWVVEDGKTGLLVEPGNVQALIAALTKLEASPERRLAMGAMGRCRFDQEFQINRSAAEITKIYLELTNENDITGSTPDI